MSQTIIYKEFHFCYGHRVWTQALDPVLSLDSCHACRRLHGHNGRVLIGLTSKELSNGMVTDFKHLNFFKRWLDDVLDHKFIIHIDDPLLRNLFPKFDSLLTSDSLSDYLVCNTQSPVYVDLSSSEKELYEGLVIVPFIPTSENLASSFAKIVEGAITGKLPNVVVQGVTLFETEKSQSIYLTNY